MMLYVKYYVFYMFLILHMLYIICMMYIICPKCTVRLGEKVAPHSLVMG